ncbi:hypothetical protein BH20ACT21_BH20ACT21_16110 [soil metagenome]
MLKGSLDGFMLPELFRLFSRSQKTGRLDVIRRAGRGHVYFRAGGIYFATSSLLRAPLGRKLISLELLTERQLMEALDLHAESGQRVGDVLVSMGAITSSQLEDALRAQIEDAIFDLMRWDRGEFSWQPDVAVATEVTLNLTVEDLIMEASRRLDEMELIQDQIPSPEAVMVMAAEAPRTGARITIAPEEWGVLVLVDGRRTVAEVASRSTIDDERAFKVLHGLARAGLIELRTKRGLAHTGRGLGPSAASGEGRRGFGWSGSSFTPEDASGAGVIEDPEFFLLPVEPPPEASQWFSDPDPAVTSFDEPGPGELMSREALEDPAGGQAPADAPDDGSDDRKRSGGSRKTKLSAGGSRKTKRVEEDEEIDSELVAKLIDGLNSL